MSPIDRQIEDLERRIEHLRCFRQLAISLRMAEMPDSLREELERRGQWVRPVVTMSAGGPAVPDDASTDADETGAGGVRGEPQGGL